MNENKTDEIIEVMNYSHKYVPERLLEELCLVNEQTITIYKSLISPILFGGDKKLLVWVVTCNRCPHSLFLCLHY